jgi:CRISPR-associated protein Cas1
MAQLQTWEDGMATLYLTEPRSLVKKDGDTLVVRIPENKERETPKRKVRVPLIKVTQVIVYGDVTLTSPALAALLKQKVDVCFCSYYGRFQGRLAPPLGKNSLIRLEQHRAHGDPARAFTLARAFVRGKLANMRTMLLRANRKQEDVHKRAEIDKAAESLQGVLSQVDGLDARDAAPPPDPSHPQADSALGSLLGLEGAGTASYFGVFGNLLKGSWEFERRQRRPPRDPVNALLSFGYVLLMNQVSSAISVVGLDPYVGFLHSSQYGKPALALDVMETFRPLVVDSVVLTLLNNRVLTERDFREELGAWWLTDAGRRTFLAKFEERLDTTIQHPVFDYKATYRRSLELEVRLVAKWLMGEVPEFKPFTVR